MLTCPAVQDQFCSTICLYITRVACVSKYSFYFYKTLDSLFSNSSPKNLTFLHYFRILRNDIFKTSVFDMNNKPQNKLPALYCLKNGWCFHFDQCKC